ncbi:MAG: hypothetical protein AAB723_02685, partial [Patescibacteria group bacterium]
IVFILLIEKFLSTAAVENKNSSGQYHRLTSPRAATWCYCALCGLTHNGPPITPRIIDVPTTQSTVRMRVIRPIFFTSFLCELLKRQTNHFYLNPKSVKNKNTRDKKPFHSTGDRKLSGMAWFRGRPGWAGFV